MLVALYNNMLVLERVEVDNKGNIYGVVVNGGWLYKEKDGFGYAFPFNADTDNLSKAVNFWQLAENSKVVIVPDSMIQEDYNDILRNCKDYADQRDFLKRN